MMKRTNEGGFTLIEVLVSLAVLGIVILPVLGMFSSSSFRNYQTNRNTVALTVGRDVLDRIKAGDIDHFNLEQEMNDYKNRYNVELMIEIPPYSESNSLHIIKVYVAPERGMNAQKDGIMVSSYATNVFVSSIDTSPPHGGDEPGGPPPDGSEEEYWDWYIDVVNSFSVTHQTSWYLPILPNVLYREISELRTPIESILATYEILVHLQDTTSGPINWGRLQGEIRTRYNTHLKMKDLY